MRGGKQRDDLEPRRWSGGLVQFPGERGTSFLLSRRQFLKRVRSVVPCGGLEVPAHERGVLSGGLEVPAHARVASNGGSGEASARWVAPDLVFFMPSGGRFGCSSTAALGPTRQWPPGVVVSAPSTSLSTLEHFSCFDSRKSAMVGGSCGCAFSPLSSLCLEFVRVDVTIQPASEYS